MGGNNVFNLWFDGNCLLLDFKLLGIIVMILFRFRVVSLLGIIIMILFRASLGSLAFRNYHYGLI